MKAKSYTMESTASGVVISYQKKHGLSFAASVEALINAQVIEATPFFSAPDSPLFVTLKGTDSEAHEYFEKSPMIPHSKRIP